MRRSRAIIAALSVLVLGAGCPKNKGGEVKEPGKTTKTETPAKKVAPEIVADLDSAQSLCKKAYDAADVEKIQASSAYNEAAAQKDYTECKAALDRALAKDATLASYKGEIDDKPYDIPALSKMAADTEGRLVIAKDTYDKIVAAQKEAERAEWEPLLKADRLKLYQERGKPTITDGADITAAAAAVAKTWIYHSEPRDQGGKMVIDVTTYTFKKDKYAGKPKTETQDYIPPE